MKKNSIKFVLVAFVTSCGFFAVPYLSSYASANHSENLVTTASSVNGSNQNQDDSIKQRLESIIQECMNDISNIYDYCSYELSQELVFVNEADELTKCDTCTNKMYEVPFWDFDFWTGEDFSAESYDILKIQYRTQDSTYVKVQFHGTDSHLQRKQTVVTIKMIYEDGKWLIDDIYNLKEMLFEYNFHKVKIPVRKNDGIEYIVEEDVIKSENETMKANTTTGAFNVNNDGQPKDDPCDRIIEAYSKCTDLCEAADNNNDDKEKKKMFMEAYNINKKLVADPATSECFPNYSFIKDNLEYIEGRLKDLGVEL